MASEQLTLDQEQKAEYNRWWAREAHHRKQQDPEYRAKKAAAAKAWREANPEWHRRLMREWAKTPKGRARSAARAQAARDAGKDWKRANPEAWRRMKSNHEAKRRAAKQTTEVEPIDRMAVYERDQGRCGICGDPVDVRAFHLDHVIPLCKGGPHTYANVQVAHPLCNIRKGGSA